MVFHFKFYLSILFFLFVFMASSLFGMEEDFLDWRARPASIVNSIESSYSQLNRSYSLPTSSWGLFNGGPSYDILGVDQCKLFLRLMEIAHQERRTDVYFLDHGAGNFQSCDAMAKYINDHQYVLPKGMRAYIVGTRGKKYLGNIIEEVGICKVYKFGSFKIEEHENELLKRGFGAHIQFALTVSRWAQRHLVDVLGTYLQLYERTHRGGFLIMDWGYYLYAGEICNHRTSVSDIARAHLLDLLLFTKSPFLFLPCGDWSSKTLDSFLLQKTHNQPLRLPLSYEGTESFDKDVYDIASGCMVRFKVHDSQFKKWHHVEEAALALYRSQDFPENPLNDYNVLWGDLKLFNWIREHRLTTEHTARFQQLFQIGSKSLTVTPLYSYAETCQRKAEVSQKASRFAEKEKKIRACHQLSQTIEAII
ncbi:MAG: hypothetical protein JSS34_07815 [Proteobacteria bacterium]|nr:hypothetical protein [Pseudomonadota bacterium]